jgi:uncharacterized protein (DUF342 family)
MSKFIIVTLNADKKSANIRLLKPGEYDPPITLEDMITDIKAANISFGINEHILADLAENPRYGEIVAFAKGVDSIPGQPGHVEFHFKTVKELRPSEREDGSVDYRDLGYVQNVRAGDVLCTLVPPQLGTPGITVTNEPIVPPVIPPARLPRGKGTEISADEQSLIASVDGQVDLAGKSVVVLNKLTLETVDMSTGNIDFVGNIDVSGDVSQGAVLKAAGNVFVRGSVDGATIISGGNVIVSNGYIGNSDCEIKAVGDVKCRYIQNGKVTAQNVEAGALIGSDIQAKDTVKIIGNKSNVLSSKIRALNLIECETVGAVAGAGEVTLEVGNDPDLIKRSKEIPIEVDNIYKQLTQLKQLDDVFNQLVAAGRIRDDQVEKHEQVRNTIVSLNEQLTEIQDEFVQTEEELTNIGYGRIIVKNVFYPTGIIRIGADTYKVINDTTHVRFTRGSDGITVGSAG